MAVTRRVTRKTKEDECIREREKAAENIRSSPWSSIMDEVLFLILMRLGLGDFASFRSVCKRWNSLATLNMNKFMATRQPMLLSFSTFLYKKYCWLEDINKRKFKTHLPHSLGRTCIGVSGGYLILYGTKEYDFWLVNPITRHELHFPRFLITHPEKVRGILVFSPSMSGWVFVLSEAYHTIWSSLAGENKWKILTYTFFVLDIHFFQGKIYTLNEGGHLYELQFKPRLVLKLVKSDIFKGDLLRPSLASWGENLYVTGYGSEGDFRAFGIDFDRLKWVCSVKTIEKCARFVNVLKSGGARKLGLWADPDEQYESFGHFHGKVNCAGKLFDAKIWYYPHESLNVNRLQELTE